MEREKCERRERKEGEREGDLGREERWRTLSQEASWFSSRVTSLRDSSGGRKLQRDRESQLSS